MAQQQRPFVAKPEEWEIVDESDDLEVVGEPSKQPPSRRQAPGRSTAENLAPAAGGVVGGMVGGIPGAIIGGGAGKGYGDLIAHGAEIPGAIGDILGNALDEPMATMQGWSQGVREGVTDTAKAAGIEGISQAAGIKVAQAGSALSKWLMNRATTRVTAKLMQEFPNLSDTLIDEALTVSKGGYAKAQALLNAAKSKTRAALGAADATGVTIPIQLSPDLADSLRTALLEKAIKSGGVRRATAGQPLDVATSRLSPEMRDLFQRIGGAEGRRAGMHSKAVAGKVFNLTPSQADILKTQLQRESRALYANRGAPNGPKAIGMDATERAEFAAQINSAIDNVAQGYRASNAEAQPLIGAVRGIKQAIRPSGNLYQAMVRPAVGGMLGAAGGSQSEIPGGSALGAIAGAAMTSPAGMSREAIILASPQVQQMLKQLPRASAVALTELLTELSRSQTPGTAPQE